MEFSDDEVFDVDVDKRKRSSNPCCGICVGLAMVIAGIWLLGWNERRTVCQMKAIYYAEDEAIVASCDKSPADYDNKLVFLSCPIKQEDMKEYDATATDSRNVGLTGIVHGVRGLCFQQQMEVFQCIEHKSRECVQRDHEGKCKRARTKFKYTKGYSPKLLHSSQFGLDEQGRVSESAKRVRLHVCGNERNPTELPTKMFAATEMATSLKMGTWMLRKPQIQRMATCGETPVSLDTDAFGDLTPQPQPPGTLSRTSVTTNGDGKLSSCSAGEETIGCLKLSFATTSPDFVTLLYKVAGGEFGHYKAPPSWMCGGEEISHIVQGKFELDHVFAMFRDQDRSLRAILRVAGYLGIFAGLCLIFGPMGWLAEHVPFCGELCGNVVGCMLQFIAAMLAGAISLITIAIMWVFMRPIIGIPLLLVGIGLLAFSIYTAYKPKPKKKRKQYSLIQNEMDDL